MSESIDQFQIEVEDSLLEDLRDRLGRTRFPDQIEGTGWEYGIPIDYLRELVEYWRDAYDWRAQEARLNSFSQFRTQIDGQSIHFIHARSAHAEAASAAHHARLAGLDRRVPRRHPAAHRPGVVRGRRSGRVPCGRAVATGLRLLRASSYAGLGRAPYRQRVHRR